MQEYVTIKQPEDIFMMRMLNSEDSTVTLQELQLYKRNKDYFLGNYEVINTIQWILNGESIIRDGIHSIQKAYGTDISVILPPTTAEGGPLLESDAYLSNTDAYESQPFAFPDASSNNRFCTFITKTDHAAEQVINWHILRSRISSCAEECFNGGLILAIDRDNYIKASTNSPVIRTGELLFSSKDYYGILINLVSIYIPDCSKDLDPRWYVTNNILTIMVNMTHNILTFFTDPPHHIENYLRLSYISRIGNESKIYGYNLIPIKRHTIEINIPLSCMSIRSTSTPNNVYHKHHSERHCTSLTKLKTVITAHNYPRDVIRYKSHACRCNDKSNDELIRMIKLGIHNCKTIQSPNAVPAVEWQYIIQMVPVAIQNDYTYKYDPKYYAIQQYPDYQYYHNYPSQYFAGHDGWHHFIDQHQQHYIHYGQQHMYQDQQYSTHPYKATSVKQLQYQQDCVTRTYNTIESETTGNVNTIIGTGNSNVTYSESNSTIIENNNVISNTIDISIDNNTINNSNYYTTPVSNSLSSSNYSEGSSTAQGIAQHTEDSTIHNNEDSTIQNDNAQNYNVSNSEQNTEKVSVIQSVERDYTKQGVQPASSQDVIKPNAQQEPLRTVQVPVHTINEQTQKGARPKEKKNPYMPKNKTKQESYDTNYKQEGKIISLRQYNMLQHNMYNSMDALKQAAQQKQEIQYKKLSKKQYKRK